MSRSCSCRPRPASTLRRRPRFFLGAAALAATGAGAALALALGAGAGRAARLVVFFLWADLDMGTLWSPCDTAHRVGKFKLSSGNRLTLQERPDKMPCSFRNAIRGEPN